MARTTMPVLAAIALAVSAGAAPREVAAGNLAGATLACYVDTYAFDQLTPYFCYAGWTPSTASNPTVAYFEVVNLSAGSYTFSWKDLDTGTTPPGCGNTQFCSTGIATDVSGDGLVRMSVKITDNATGLSTTATAEAQYLDAWH